MPNPDNGHLGPIDAEDPAFAPDRELTPDPQQQEGDQAIMDMLLDMVTPETSDEKAQRYYREAEEETERRRRMTEMKDRLRERRQTRQEEAQAAQQQVPPGGTDAFSLDRAVQDILQKRNEALTYPGT